MTFWKAALLIPALALLGCSGKEKKDTTGTVKGKVTLDGSPLATGKIIFEDAPGVPAAELAIKDGAYQGTAIVGKKTVRIVATKVGPPPKGMPGMPGAEEEIPLPAKYNKASTDTREVKEGDNSFDFEVKTK